MAAPPPASRGAARVGWEIGEWCGTALETAYEDTLGDEALGALGGIVAALIVVRTRRGARGVGLRPAAAGP